MEDEINIYILKIKLALAFALLRIKPCHITAIDFVKSLTVNVCQDISTTKKRCKDLQMELALYKTNSLCQQTNIFFEDLQEREDTIYPISQTTDLIECNVPSIDSNNWTSVPRCITINYVAEQIMRVDYIIQCLPLNHDLSSRLRENLWSNVLIAWQYLCETLNIYVNSQINTYENLHESPTLPMNTLKWSWLFKLVKVVDLYGRSIKKASYASLNESQDQGYASQHFIASQYDVMSENAILCRQMRNLKSETIRALCQGLHENTSEINSLGQIIKARILIYLARHDSMDDPQDLEITFDGLNQLMTHLNDYCDHLKSWHESQIKLKYSTLKDEKSALKSILPPPILLYNIFYLIFCMEFLLLTFVYNYTEQNILIEMNEDNNLSTLHSIPEISSKSKKVNPTHQFFSEFRSKLEICISNLSDKYPLLFYKIYHMIDFINS